MVNCSSIVIKLFAWEQIHGIISRSPTNSPPANSTSFEMQEQTKLMGFMSATSNVGGSALRQETRKGWREIISSVSLHNAIKTEMMVHLDNSH